MKYYKSFILFSLFALAFVSCNTDDLERDIDALKDRVTNVEAQVQQLNDEMNIIRVLLDGNKTITDYSINGDTYTLTLSNGETLTLTPGVTGGNYPSIEIGTNGNWFIGGTDTGWRAQAENGEDARIQIFEIICQSIQTSIQIVDVFTYIILIITGGKGDDRQ
jgi:hypothetical protein